MASSSPNKRQVFDQVRKRWVEATPEEIVRQTLLNRMIHQMGYPPELIAVEKQLSELPYLAGSSPPDRRIDLVCFAKNGEELFPLLLVECKRDSLDKRAIDQVIGYNSFVKAPFVGVANLEQVILGSFDPMKQEYVFGHALPFYRDLLALMKKPKGT